MTETPGPANPPGADPGAAGRVGHVARQSALLVGSGVISFGGGLVLNILLARVLGATAFGAWVIAFAVAQLLSTVGLAGGDWLVLRQGSYFHGLGDAARLRRTIHVALLLSAVALAVLSLVLFAGADAISTRFFGGDALAGLLRLTAVVTPIIGIRQILVYGTQAFKNMRAAALNRNILQPLFRLACTAVAVLIAPTALSAFVGLVGAEACLLMAAFVALQRKLPLIGPVDDVDWRSQVRFALPAWGSRLAGQSRAQLFPILLGSLVTVSSSGVFAACMKVANAPASIINTVNQVYSAVGSDLFLRGLREEFAGLYRSLTKWTFVMALPVFCLMVAFPSQVLSLFGRRFDTGTTALVVLGIGVLFQFATGPVTVTLILIGRAGLALADYLLVVAVELTLGLILMPRYGVLGAAIAKGIGTMLNNVLPLFQVYRSIGVFPYRLDFLKPVAAGAAAIVVARIVVGLWSPASSVLAVAGATAVIGVVYLGVLLALGLSDEDRAAIRSLLVRRRGGGGAEVVETDLAQSL